MIDRTHDLPVTRQAKILNISRGCVYYQSRPVSAQDLALMRRIDELHLEYPFAGSRMLRDLLPITMEAAFCVEALEEALANHGTPGIFNTDQGSQFTSEAFTSVLIASKIAISMDGKGAWRDNVFVERIWKSVKYEEVYLHAYDSVGVARASLGRYLNFYNRLRPHSSLDRMTPEEAYFHPSPVAAAA